MSDHIPFEIQEQIIKKLPIKSLLKFRLVSKPWKSLIDSSKFIADHYNVCKAQPERLFISYNKEEDEAYYYYFNDVDPNQYVLIVDDDSFTQHKFAPPLPVPVNSFDDFGSIEVVGSSHGLLCFYGSDEYVATKMAVIWNPSIRKSVGIHVPGLYGMPYETILGFGVCPRNLDPKFIKLPHNIPLAGTRKHISCDLKQVKVFALSSCTWRSPYGNLPRASVGFQKPQVVLDGFIYWLAFDEVKSDFGSRYDILIISFDLTSEEFGEVHLPESLVENGLVGKYLSISKLRESLVVLEYEYNTYSQSQLSAIWIMGPGVPKSFTKLYTFEGPDKSIERIFGFRKSGEFIIERQDDCEDQYSREIALYEPDSKQISKTGIVRKTCLFSVHSYMETLLLLDQPDGIVHKNKEIAFIQYRGGPKKRRRSIK